MSNGELVQLPSAIQKLSSHLADSFGVEIWIKRDDVIHDAISGNKYRKLKYNLDYIQENDINEVITFGGAHSNHIDAVAHICQLENLKCTGLIRGDENSQLSPTLLRALDKGMKIQFVSRSNYKKRNDKDYLAHLRNLFPGAFIIPEGGANHLGVKGCEDIVDEVQNEVNFDCISVDCGTGATLAGMVRKLAPHQKAIGVQVLKGVDFISKEVNHLNTSSYKNFEVWTDYHFGGYAKYQPELIDFMRWFYEETNIRLDPVYTGKQFFAVFDQLKKGYFPKETKLVLVHTGGLQGIEGFEKRYGVKIY